MQRNPLKAPEHLQILPEMLPQHVVDINIKGIELIDMLELEHKCSFCGDPITPKNFGYVFSNPPQVSCKKFACLINRI